MLLSEITPYVNSKKLDTISGNDSVLSAINLLRENQFVPLLVEARSDPSEPRVLSSFSIISRLAELRSSGFEEYLNSSASESALAIGSIDDQHDILSLFHVFEATSLSFAEVHRNNKPAETILSLKSLLGLYAFEIFFSDLTLGDVASAPVFSLSRGTKFEQVLSEMLNRKFRRIQIAGTKTMVSDREVLAFLFGKDRLKKVTKSPERLLDGTLEEIERKETPWLENSRKLKDAASELSTRDQEAILTDRGLITPWDLTIKPWRLGELRIADQAPNRS